MSPEFLADPYPALRRLRDDDPVHWSDAIGAWLLTRYDDVLGSTLDLEHFTRQGRMLKALDHLAPAEQRQLDAFACFYGSGSLVHADPPDHTRLRRLFLKWGFTPGQVEALRPRIEQTVEALLDRVVDDGQMDVMEAVAFDLPIAVLCLLLGVPQSDRRMFRRLADRLLAFQTRRQPTYESLLAAQDAILEIHDYLAAQKERIRLGANAQDGLLTRMVVAQETSGALSETELVNNLGTLLLAGHETTASLVSSGLLCLLQHPDQWRLLCETPTLIPAAIEEMLRFESPLARNTRLVKQDTQLGGKPLRKGEMVIQMLNAANRDPVRFEDPDVFDIERPRLQNLAFGYGISFCIGAPLARLEAHVFFKALIRRMPGIRLADEHPRWAIAKPTVRILETLPVTF